MTTSIELWGVDLEYAVYSTRAQSLRQAALNLAVGGRLLRRRDDLLVVQSLSNIHFKVAEGDRLALIGHNGSGKTSLLRVLAGIYEPTRGVVTIQGRVTSMIALGAGLDPEATGRQNIRHMALLRGFPKKVIEARLPSIIEFSELGAFIDMPFKTYSAGMMARLVFAVATELPADILIMDEWLSAGDASFIAKASERMERLVEEARLVVLATHDFNLVQRICNKVCVLEGGKMIFFGSPQEWAEKVAARAEAEAAAALPEPHVEAATA